jgi:hypothetical protein
VPNIKVIPAQEILFLYGSWGEFESKRKAVRRGWRNLHKEEPDNLYSWRKRTGLMK